MGSGCGAGTPWLESVLDEVENNCGPKPDQVLVDGGYVSASNLEKREERGVELIGPVPDVTSIVHQQAEQRGVSAAYRQEAFGYVAQNDTYRCRESNMSTGPRPATAVVVRIRGNAVLRPKPANEPSYAANQVR
jgi:hypothetical protein